jgi:hypothetical protein
MLDKSKMINEYSHTIFQRLTSCIFLSSIVCCALTQDNPLMLFTELNDFAIVKSATIAVETNDY